MTAVYIVLTPKLAGTDYKEVSRKARALYKKISARTKRKPYIRSAFFNKEKIFLDYFWGHLQEKNWQDRFRRLIFYAAAIEVIQNSHISPTIVRNPNKKSEVFYRFYGITKDGSCFIVQIKEDGRKNKHFISVFPA